MNIGLGWVLCTGTEGAVCGTEGAVGQAELMFAALERNQRAKATMIPSADTGYLGRKVTTPPRAGSHCATRPPAAVSLSTPQALSRVHCSRSVMLCHVSIAHAL